jgi:phosphonate transport system ATP-binding protein
MIKVDNLSVIYEGSKAFALNEINLTFKQGEFVCILGKSGAGKSTLIRTFNGLQKPSNGKVFYQNHDLTNISEKALRKVRSEIGMIFQGFHLIPRLTVLHNVLTGSFGRRNSFKSILGIFSVKEINSAKKQIDRVELSDHLQKRVEHLSGGQKQRVAIARALLQKPSVFLGDEPVASLDPGTSKRIFDLLQKLHEDYKLLTVINVHDVGLAKAYATRIIGLKDGLVVFDGTPDELTEVIENEIYA